MTLARADGARYERWRSQWLAGTASQAATALRWHGLATALALTAPRAAGPLPARPAAPAPACAGAALQEAAGQIRKVLRDRGGRADA